ncbi:MAG: hypothetical protein IKD20_03060 [Clostridia bacterium]|nr:hypothetical protein [Clostridia bacterium]
MRYGIRKDAIPTIAMKIYHIKLLRVVWLMTTSMLSTCDNVYCHSCI